jgi:hypothetical protein
MRLSQLSDEETSFVADYTWAYIYSGDSMDEHYSIIEILKEIGP